MNEHQTWPALLGRLMGGESLAAEDTAWAMHQIMMGEATAAQVAGFAVALRVKGETVAEITGLARAMLEHATPIKVPGSIVDLVGTGGDRAHTVNVSTMGAIIAAAAGAKVVKHGNRAASSACGSADLLEELGVVIDLPAPLTARVAEEVGITFCFASLFHPALRHAGPVRRDLGVPTPFNFLGPLTNPAHPMAQAVGVSDARMCGIMAGVLAERGSSALVFRGDDGLDEITTTTTSTVWVVRDAVAAEERFDPADLGIPRSRPEDLRGADGAYNASVARALFAGERGPVRDAVLVNAAAALAAADDSASALVDRLRDGMARAAEAVDSGRASDLVDRWVHVTRRLARESG